MRRVGWFNNKIPLVRMRRHSVAAMLPNLTELRLADISGPKRKLGETSPDLIWDSIYAREALAYAIAYKYKNQDLKNDSPELQNLKTKYNTSDFKVDNLKEILENQINYHKRFYGFLTYKALHNGNSEDLPTISAMVDILDSFEAVWIWQDVLPHFRVNNVAALSSNPRTPLESWQEIVDDKSFKAIQASNPQTLLSIIKGGVENSVVGTKVQIPFNEYTAFNCLRRCASAMFGFPERDGPRELVLAIITLMEWHEENENKLFVKNTDDWYSYNHAYKIIYANPTGDKFTWAEAPFQNTLQTM